jgi:hypothetical protein
MIPSHVHPEDRADGMPSPTRHALGRLRERHAVELSWDQFESIEARLRDFDARRVEGPRGGRVPEDPALRYEGAYPSRRPVLLYWVGLREWAGSDAWIPVLFNPRSGCIETCLSLGRGVRRCG